MIDFLRRSFGPIEQPDPGGWRARQAGALERTQTRAINSFTSHPGLTEQLLAVQGLNNRPWRVATIKEAMGVPSNFRSVALIANTTGSLAMEAYRKGVLLDSEDTPRIIQRPDPFRIPRDFYRDTAFDQATRGEYWWWIASRDIDDTPLSAIRIAPWEIKVEYTGDRLRPDIFWGNRKMPLRDLRHGTFLPDPDSMTGPWQRGVGPLQLCGAAISVQVESDQWAANFFADGGYPSMWIKAAGELGELEEPDANGDTEEAAILLRKFRERDHNTPFISDDGIEDVTEFGQNAQGSQMLESREQNKGTSANLFGVPGALLEYGRPGSSLTYQTVTEVFTTFVRATLAPDYLESIEQNMSDLLTRSTVARFNVKGFLRADSKTRAEVYNLLVPLGVMTVEQAQMEEGIVPGDVEYAPIPFAPPQAIPTLVPRAASMAVRCPSCNKLVARSLGPGSDMDCPRCKAEVRVA